MLGSMYGPSPVRKAAALIVLTVRLRACIRPLDEAPSASGHDGNPHVFAFSITSASWALRP